MLVEMISIYIFQLKFYGESGVSVFQVFCCNTNLSKKVAISVLLWCLVDPLGSEIEGKIDKAQRLLEADVCSGDS